MIRTIRVLGAALGAFIGLGIAAATGLFTGLAYAGFILAAWTIAWLIVGFALLPYLTVVPARWLVKQVQDLSTAEFVAAILGLFVGLLLGLLLGLPLAQIEGPLGTWLPLGISLFLGLGMMGLTVAKRFDLIAAAEGAGLIRRPGSRDDPMEGEPRIVVDTSVLIDGRIAEIVDSGFIYGTLVVPRFVLEELQHIADSSDALRRNRGRRGLEILSRMQRDARTPVEIVEDEAPGVAEVDAKLVELAKRRSRVVLTNDFNLNRVAELQGVRVMNINSLANASSPPCSPARSCGSRSSRRARRPGRASASSTTAR